MENWISTVFLVVVLIATMAYLVHIARDSIKQLPVFKVKRAWYRLEHYEQHFLKAGFILFIPIPVIKNHVTANTYLLEFMVEFLPALASAMLIAGIMALVREIHIETKERQSDESEKAEELTTNDA